MELRQITSDELDKILTKESNLGYFEDMKNGDELWVPVANDGEGSYVFFGPLDFSGKTNNSETWEDAMSEITGYKPEYKTVLRKTSDDSKLWIYGNASSSIGPCDGIAVYNNIFDLIMSVFQVQDINASEYKTILEDKDLDKAKAFCEEEFDHSFFTGLVFGPFEYVSGPKPNELGYAIV